MYAAANYGFINFRKATLPIEVELNEDDDADSDCYQPEDSEERERICSEMKKMKEAIDHKAMENINDAHEGLW